jgi:hypothetical protein
MVIADAGKAPLPRTAAEARCCFPLLLLALRARAKVATDRSAALALAHAPAPQITDPFEEARLARQLASRLQGGLRRDRVRSGRSRICRDGRCELAGAPRSGSGTPAP